MTTFGLMQRWKENIKEEMQESKLVLLPLSDPHEIKLHEIFLKFTIM